jgi:two-component system, OmpR family, copper resistance phosphate regulon response regulator CusR
MRLLIIEDEKRTAAHLKKGLSENGFTVDVAYDGSEGLQLAYGGGYSLIVLDVMLPQQDGWTILEELRRSGVMTPVLFLTARDRVEDRVKGLEMGADDYLIKPYAFSELLARVRTILRRGSTIQDEVLRVADLEIDTRRHKAVRAGNKPPSNPSGICAAEPSRTIGRRGRLTHSDRRGGLGYQL